MKTKFSYRLIFIIFFCQIVGYAVAFLIVSLLFACGVNIVFFGPLFPIAAVLLSSLVISCGITMFRTRHMSSLMDEIYAAMQRISKGDFSKKIILVDDDRDRPMKEIALRLNDVMDELNSIALLKKDFVNNFSHEFKTPIASIQGFAQILLNDKTLSQEERENYYRIIAEESKRLTKLSEMTLLMSKLDSFSLDNLQRTKIYLDAQIEECALQFYQEVEKKQLNVEIEVEHVDIFANKELLKELWLNLFSNAIKYTSEKGEIKIYSYTTEKEIAIAFKDNGIGMDEQTRKHIFDEYYQADSSRVKKGIGLGLTICKKICDIHNYRLDVNSSIGQGSVFTVYLKKEHNSLVPPSNE